VDILSSLTILSGLVLYASVSRLLEDSPLPGPILFVVFGWVCGPEMLNLIRIDFSADLEKTLAELTLVFVLFTDSSKISFAELRAHSSYSLRLLGIGLPLTIAAGFGAAYLLFDELSLWEAALLAVIVAPTDAALGRAVVSNERVPQVVRRALNVESGLNDGICVPALHSCIIAVVVAAGLTAGESQPSFFVLFSQAIGFGLLAGFGVALLSARAIAASTERGWVEKNWGMLSLLATPLLCFVLAEYIRGSGFLAAFVAGLTMGNARGCPRADTYMYAEASGDLLSYITWVVFGAAVVGGLFAEIDVSILLYAVLSLTVVRMLPVAIALMGTKARWDTRMFIGWFGPRGLASIVFAVVVLNESGIADRQTIVHVVAWTILLSVIAHGVTANAGAKWFADRHKQ